MNVADNNKEHGQATISVAVTDGQIFEGSLSDQYKAAPAAIVNNTKVKKIQFSK